MHKYLIYQKNATCDTAFFIDNLRTRKLASPAFRNGTLTKYEKYTSVYSPS